MLIIWCENDANRKCPKAHESCCCECLELDCLSRCRKKLIDECEDFSEEID